MRMFNGVGEEAVQTFIGTALVKFATGVIGIWGTVNLYFFSHLRNNGHKVSPQTNSLLMLCVGIPVSVLVLLSTRFSSVLGYKTVIRICALLFTVVPLVLNYSLNLFTLGFCFLFMPMVCFAISSIPIINCLWS